MAEIVKPNMNLVWASGGAIIAPSNTKIQQGWTAEIPPHQWENWEQNRQDSALLYLMQKGIPEWDATTEYWANRSFVQRNGNLYKAIRNNTNADPLTAGSDWTKAIPSATTTVEGTAIRATSAEVIAGTNDTKFITSKGLQDKLDSPTTGYLRSSNNLSDVANADTARQNIGVRPATNALAGLIRINTAAESTARTSDAVALTPLGLARNITTSNTDTTAGRLLKVGDLGTNLKTTQVINGNDLPSLYPYSGKIPFLSNIGSTNKPAKGDFYYVDQAQMSSGGNTFQLWMPYRADQEGLYYRTRFNNGWSNFVEVFTSLNFNPGDYSPVAHTHTIAQVTGLQSALDAKQNNLGYTPVNRAGDTMTGHLGTSGRMYANTFAATNRLQTGQDPGDWATGVFIDLTSMWFQNSHNKYRVVHSDGNYNLDQYSGTGTWIGNVFSVTSNRVVNFTNRPTSRGRDIAEAGLDCIHSGEQYTIPMSGTGTFYLPAGFFAVGFQTNANSDIRYVIGTKVRQV